jgi:broad specificity phosphatase PhoE
VARATTILLVRHAEKGATPAKDPPLTAAGEARARALVGVTRDAGIDAIITSQYLRTRATAAPTAAALDITPDVITAGTAASVANVVSAVRRHAGGSILVVGHSDTLPAIIEALTGRKPGAICDATYDNLFVVTLGPNRQPSLVRAKYGAPSPVDPACAHMMR